MSFIDLTHRKWELGPEPFLKVVVPFVVGNHEESGLVSSQNMDAERWEAVENSAVQSGGN